MKHCSAWFISLSPAVVLVLCWLCPGVESIICYHCNSAYDPRCGDPFDPYSLGKINCSMQPPLEHLPYMEPTVCRKNVQKVYGKIRVVRSCGFIEDPDREEKSCVRRSGTHDVQMLYCACKGDICNPASTTIAPGLLMVLAMSAIGASVL
ncbi:uncharacterized protein LOC128985851 [Macrosteles quadrilineatus]|uniref:uncharacterized protein LOC128985734 n=1 Tax=Macrosteles quadrilineatus TaxID=74068 RepID=UPI0023E23B2D|nr:uncharacterized protein LOC128985734 [Macrosteles quadrilineatus]XP_054261769.1 uncharacterized protein LOC128985851 [Macrosteles quadrilineatus]